MGQEACNKSIGGLDTNLNKKATVKCHLYLQTNQSGILFPQ